jgi:hypothetical protein
MVSSASTRSSDAKRDPIKDVNEVLAMKVFTFVIGVFVGVGLFNSGAYAQNYPVPRHGRCSELRFLDMQPVYGRFERQ